MKNQLVKALMIAEYLKIKVYIVSVYKNEIKFQGHLRENSRKKIEKKCRVKFKKETHNEFEYIEFYSKMFGANVNIVLT